MRAIEHYRTHVAPLAARMRPRTLDAFVGQDHTLVYKQPIAAILLDVTMPDMNGLDLCRTLRTIPQFQTLPVIMITSKDAPFDQVQGRMAGANAYLTNPFDETDLKGLIQRLIETPLSGKSTRL